MEIPGTHAGSRLRSPGAPPVIWKRVVGVTASAWAPAAGVLLVYGLWFGVLLGSGHDPRELVFMERQTVQRSHALPAVRIDPRLHYYAPTKGYDGQYYYLIALDPVRARPYMDDPSGRYRKILYPLAAHALALGRSDLVPYTLIVINWLMLGVGTWAVAAWLRLRGLSPWLSLLYGLYPGLFLALQRDLTEPLAYGLLALGVYAFERLGKFRLVGTGTLFALAVLARDKSAIFVFVFALALLLQREPDTSWKTSLVRNAARAAVLLGLAGLPMLAYVVFLKVWLGGFSSPIVDQAGPLAAVSVVSTGQLKHLIQFVAVLLPSVLCGLLAVWAIVRRNWGFPVWVLLVSIQLGTVTIAPVYFTDVVGSLRVAIMVLLAAIYAVPIFDRLTGGSRWWLWLCALCWLWLEPFLLLSGSLAYQGHS